MIASDDYFNSIQILHLFIFNFLCRNPVRCKAISPFEVNNAIPLLQRKGFAKAIREIELILGIPNDIALFKRSQEM